MDNEALQVTLRCANVTDAPAIVQIYVDSWNLGFNGLLPPITFTNERVARWERDLLAPLPQRWWAAEAGKSIIGFVGIGPSRDLCDPTLGELDTIAVTPAWWRSGVGRRLMQEALLWLRLDGYQEAILWTLAHYPRGQRFYEAMGWQLDGSVRDEGRQIRYRYKL